MTRRGILSPAAAYPDRAMRVLAHCAKSPHEVSMAASLDDFSLLVDLKGPSDLTRRPAYRSPLDATDSKLAEVLAPYDFAEPYPCGLASCRQPHQHGFLVVTVDKVETNVGKDCGRRIFGEDFAIKANLQAARASRKRQLDTLQGVLARKKELLGRISELYGRKNARSGSNGPTVLNVNLTTSRTGAGIKEQRRFTHAQQRIRASLESVGLSPYQSEIRVKKTPQLQLNAAPHANTAAHPPTHCTTTSPSPATGH